MECEPWFYGSKGYIVVFCYVFLPGNLANRVFDFTGIGHDKCANAHSNTLYRWILLQMLAYDSRTTHHAPKLLLIHYQWFRYSFTYIAIPLLHYNHDIHRSNGYTPSVSPTHIAVTTPDLSPHKIVLFKPGITVAQQWSDLRNPLCDTEIIHLSEANTNSGFKNRERWMFFNKTTLLFIDLPCISVWIAQ